MRRTALFTITIIVALALNQLKGQSPSKDKYLSITASYGAGKIGYYLDHTPVYIGASDKEAIEYSPSYSLKLEKYFTLNPRFDFSIGLSHLTITEKTHQTARPDWFAFSEKNLSQGFFHIVPNLIIKLPDDRFSVSLGSRLGTASFTMFNRARQSSNSLGSLHADISTEIGFSCRIGKQFLIDSEWIHGLTKYDYSISSPVVSISYFKYHSFQFGFRYIIRHAKKK